MRAQGRLVADPDDDPGRRRPGVVRASPDEVQALLFLDQRVVAGGGAPSYNARRALVTMVRTDRGWLVGNVQTG